MERQEEEMKFTCRVNDSFYASIDDDEIDEDAVYEVEVNMGAETVEAKLISVGHANADACKRLLGADVVYRNEDRVADAFNVHDAYDDEMSQRDDYQRDMRHDR